jgi:hypothetical protein
VAKIAQKRHGKDDCLRIPPYDHRPGIEIIVVKNVGIHIHANKEINFIVVEIDHIKTIFIVIYNI